MCNTSCVEHREVDPFKQYIIDLSLLNPPRYAYHLFVVKTRRSKPKLANPLHPSSKPKQPKQTTKQYKYLSSLPPLQVLFLKFFRKNMIYGTSLEAKYKLFKLWLRGNMNNQNKQAKIGFRMMKNKTQNSKTSKQEHPHWVRLPIRRLKCNYMIHYSQTTFGKTFCDLGKWSTTLKLGGGYSTYLLFYAVLNQMSIYLRSIYFYLLYSRVHLCPSINSMSLCWNFLFFYSYLNSPLFSQSFISPQSSYPVAYELVSSIYFQFILVSRNGLIYCFFVILFMGFLIHLLNHNLISLDLVCISSIDTSNFIIVFFPLTLILFVHFSYNFKPDSVNFDTLQKGKRLAEPSSQIRILKFHMPLCDSTPGLKVILPNVCMAGYQPMLYFMGPSSDTLLDASRSFQGQGILSKILPSHRIISKITQINFKAAQSTSN
ncbi:hypothetical protein VP01_3838g1 [Puccinia sorghi]|uniref:Uncharacterized protein n=1 Tax=Puccinia sorghi TaxID=27349 RepID=A0A0L6UU03_9BASI|nr:hypothetical protein VP01_3838g1 [Puccinia sorghi]